MPEGTVKQPALEKCLGCARAASTYPQSTFAEIAVQYRSNPEFKAAFEQCKQSMVKGSGYIKPFREQEVSKAVIYGKRLETSYDFMPLDTFSKAFGTDAKEAVPDQVVKVNQHDGREVEGVAIRPANSSQQGQRLIFFSEELSLHQDKPCLLGQVSCGGRRSMFK